MAKPILKVLKNYFKIMLLVNFLAISLCLLSKKVSENIKLEFQNETDVDQRTTSLKELLKCETNDSLLEIIENDRFYTVKNYIKASKSFECHETITYTTHGEFRYIENVIPVVKRWNAPISVAIYAPGFDLIAALNVIFYLRNCHDDKNLIRELTSFHIFFDKMDNNTLNILTLYESLEKSLKCEDAQKFLNVPRNETFRVKNNLKYPINYARNLARTSATTYFVFPCDIELYPNPNFIPMFFDMIINDKEGRWLKDKNVFAFAVFEIEPNIPLPDTKKDLIDLYIDDKVFWFHENVCESCHIVPESEKWIDDTDFSTMKIITTIKRQGEYHHWEPFYIGTNKDPLFDDRLTFEGSYDKMPQAYTLCVLNYDFNILSNGFLIHKHGVKTKEEAISHEFDDGRKFILEEVVPTIHQEFGKRRECSMFYTDSFFYWFGIWLLSIRN